MRCYDFFIEFFLFIFIGIIVPVVVKRIIFQRWIVVMTECMSLVLLFALFIFLRKNGFLLSSYSEMCVVACAIEQVEVDYRMRKSASGEVSLIRLFIEGICFLFLLKAIDILIDIG